MTIQYEVTVSVTIEGSTIEDSIEHIDKSVREAVGRPSNFSGAGMGMRDHGWVATSQLDAKRIVRKLQNIGLPAKIRQRETDIAEGDERKDSSAVIERPKGT